MAEVATGGAPKTRTPWHLWLVGALALLWSATGAFDWAATVTRFEPYLALFPAEMLEYWLALPGWLFAVWGVAITAAVVGSILLLTRRKVAAPLFTVSLIGPALSFAVPFLYPPPEGMGDPYSAALISGIAILLLVYSIWMTRRGMLR